MGLNPFRKMYLTKRIMNITATVVEILSRLDKEHMSLAVKMGLDSEEEQLVVELSRSLLFQLGIHATVAYIAELDSLNFSGLSVAE
jgi:hypothetical protein